MIPRTQTALWVDVPGPDATVALKHDVPVPTPGPHEVLVQVECSGLCHSDVYNMTGAHPMSVHVAGHEGIGRVVQLGAAPRPGSVRLGQRVGIQWLHETCQACEVCARDRTLCPHQHNAGRDVPGALQQYVVAPGDQLAPIPDGLPSEVAAPLLCAGLTLYSAIAKARCQPGDWLVLQGAGGGLGHLGIQIAALKGYKVIAVDSPDKRDFCLGLGAAAFFPFDSPSLEADVLALAGGGLGAHAAVCCVGAGPAYAQALRLLRRGGTLVCVGLPANPAFQLPVGPMELVVRGLTVLGSSVGSAAELQELLQLALAGRLKPVVHALPWSDYQTAIDLVKGSKVNGRVVVRIQPPESAESAESA